MTEKEKELRQNGVVCTTIIGLIGVVAVVLLGMGAEKDLIMLEIQALEDQENDKQ